MKFAVLSVVIGVTLSRSDKTSGSHNMSVSVSGTAEAGTVGDDGIPDPYPDVTMPFEPPTAIWDPTKPAPAFYEWQKVFPFLGPLIAHTNDILEEFKSAPKWFDWPEMSLYDSKRGDEWKVFPFLHTFPGNDPSASTWIQPSVAACPKTAALLRKIPGIRTALFSNMGPKTALTPHSGWALLSNHVLRLHLPLYVPDEDARPCGLVVDEEVRYHKVGNLIVFDDSKAHMAFNNHATESRYVLIFDIARPEGLPKGTATGDATAELTGLIDYFK